MTNDIKAIVADLEKLDRAATPAPWGAARSLCCRDRGTVSVQETGHTQPSHAFSTWDADLVAAARNALPALLAELHRLWAVEEAARRGCVTVDLNKLPHRDDPRVENGGEAARGGLVSPSTPPPTWATRCRQCDGTGYIDQGEMPGPCAVCDGTSRQQAQESKL